MRKRADPGGWGGAGRLCCCLPQQGVAVDRASSSGCLHEPSSGRRRCKSTANTSSTLQCVPAVPVSTEMAQDVGTAVSGNPVAPPSQPCTRLQTRLSVWFDDRQNPLMYDVTWGGVVSCGCVGKQGPDQSQFDGWYCSNSPRHKDCTINDIMKEFGNGLYNDHHYHYGYWIYAAAVVARCALRPRLTVTRGGGGRGEACGGRPERGGEWTAKPVKRPPHQPAQPPVRQPLGPTTTETTPQGTQAAAAVRKH